ncbi:MAG: AraC family transcriptional regulator [Rhodospirillaceae bacterium]|nr:MAG: AraC family transcriptional regulator [Rhodospirillaceae bacterium]
MTQTQDWLSRLLDLVPVHGRLDLRCFYGAPWRIDQGPAAHGEIPYHILLSGSAMLEDPAGKSPTRLSAGDILVLPQGPLHMLHDGSGAPAVPAQARSKLNLTISENDGDGSRLDMLCGHFVLATPHDRLLRNYLPPRLVVHTAATDAVPDENGIAESGAAAQLSGLVALMRHESAADHLGGRAMLNALSTALFALTLRLASEASEAPMGLLALAGHPRLAPALDALFNQPGRAWTLPDLARLCHMSRATLARHFDEKLGRSASDLLTDIRMTVAAGELRKPSASTGAVAEAVGYQSEAAFQRAFKQHMGVTPAAWRRAARSGTGDAADSEAADSELS